MRNTTLLIAGILACTGALRAQISGPVTGFVFDRDARGIRPILGVPGAAYQGDVMLAGFELAAVAPNQLLAIGIREGRLHRIDGLDNGAPAATDLQVETPGARRIVWNRTSSAAAIRGEAGQLWLWRAEGDVAELAEPAGTIALAVDPGGERAVAAVQGDLPGLYVLEPGAAPRLVAAAAEPSAVEFARNSRDLFFADRARGEILVVTDYAGQAAVALFASASPELSGVVGLAVWEDSLLVAGRDSRNLAVYRTGSGELVTQAALEFEPSGVELFSGARYLLNPGAGPGQPMQLLDAGSTLDIRFVPAVALQGGIQ